jgi:hypothetical protein
MASFTGTSFRIAKSLGSTRFEESLNGKEPEWIRIAAMSRGERSSTRLQNAAFDRKPHRRDQLIV